jgi:hypothetical protein
MRRIVVLAALLVLSSAAPARAQATADHLKCFKVKDPNAKTKYMADLSGVLAQSGCEFKSAAAMACVPSAAENVSPVPPGVGASGTPNTFGCYKLKCPKGVVPPLTLDDAFGSRVLDKGVAKMICAPAAQSSTCVAPAEPTILKLLSVWPGLMAEGFPAACGGSTPTCCPGGTPVSPCGVVHEELRSISLVDVTGADRLDVSMDLVLQTLESIPVNVPLVGDCLLDIDTTADGSPTAHFTVQLGLSPDHLNVVSASSATVTNLSASDLSLSGNFACALADFGLNFSIDLLTDQLASASQQQFVGACLGQH